MPADLTGLTPYLEASKKGLEQSFQPTGGVNEEELSREVQKRLWGTGTTAGIYSEMARRRLNELQPETMYSTSRAVSDSIQQLADQYASRQRGAIESGRTGEMIGPTFRAGPEATASGYYEGLPTLGRTEAETRQKSLEAWIANESRKADIAKWQGIGGAAGSLLERTGLMDWLFGSQGGRAGGTGTGGTGGTGGVVGGVLNTAAKKAWDLITGAATSAPYLSTAPLSAEAAQIASQLVAQGIPQTIAYEAANATAVEGLSPAGESISNFLANFSSATAPAAGVAAGVGPAAPSIEAGLVEMLGPELAAQLGYTAAPAAAATGVGLAGANVGAGLTPAAVEAMTGLSTGAGTGMTVGAATPAAAWALPAAAIGLPVAAGLSAGLANQSEMNAEYRAKEAFQSQLSQNPALGQQLLANFRNEVDNAIAAGLDIYPGDVMTRAIQRTGLPVNAGIALQMTSEQPYDREWGRLHEWLRSMGYSIYANPYPNPGS